MIEVAGVYVEPETLRLDGGVETLVNPLRDAGPTRIHGIRASDLLEAKRARELGVLILDEAAGLARLRE